MTPLNCGDTKSCATSGASTKLAIRSRDGDKPIVMDLGTIARMLLLLKDSLVVPNM